LFEWISRHRVASFGSHSLKPHERLQCLAPFSDDAGRAARYSPRPMNDNLRGALFMTVSMGSFAVEDLCIKSAAKSAPVGQVMLVMGLLGLAWFASRAAAAGESAFPPAMLSRTMALRSSFEIGGRLFYTLAIALIPLSVASAILQATPLVVVSGAALLFGERVGAWRWALTILGFLGVLLILRPGLEGFDALSLLALLGMLGFAGRDLATRAAPPALSNAQLGVAGFAVLTVSGVVLLAFAGGPQWPTTGGSAMTVAAAVFGIAGYSLLTMAMRTGDVSAVTPFRYTRLVFAMALGVFLLGERPDALTIAGSAMVVASGVLILTSSRRRVAAAVPAA